MKWTLAEQINPRLARELSQELEIPGIISQILVNRGTSTPQAIKSFFYPTLEDLSDPMSIPGMGLAVDRIIKALANRERIVIFGDYDVDGITSTALLYLVLSRFGANVDWYLPNRVDEGYGLSKSGIDNAIDKGSTLLISVDCGITGIEEVEYAYQKGLDCVITDHHEPGNDLPEAIALVDPKLGPEDAQTRDLAGVGVAFKVAEALFDELNEDKSLLFEHLDLVGLGTVADIVPLTGENRILAKFGLRQLESTKKLGLKSLLQITKLWGTELFSWNIVFVLAPRLNAVGRIGSAKSAFDLLTTHDSLCAAQMSRFLDEENKKRKKLDQKIFEEAAELVETTVDLENDKAIVLDSSEWHVGVIGIVASRLVEKYHRPTVLISTTDGVGQGSARTISSFHLLNAIKKAGIHLEKFGGHKFAAGLSILPEKIEDFRKEFTRLANEELTPENMIPHLNIDAQIDIGEIDMKLLDWLKLFSPHGPKNMRPIFMAKNVNIIDKPHVVGKNHLRFKVMGGRKAIDVIAFGFGDMKHQIANAIEPINLAFVIEKNDYYGYPQLQLRIKDIFIGDLTA